MDFDSINTAADADAGADLHLRHPQLRHPLYTGPGANAVGEWEDREQDAQPVILRVRGAESAKVKSAVRRLQKASVKHPQAELDVVALAIPLVMEVCGVTRDGRDLTASDDDLRWLFGRSQDFAAQVFQFAADAANFFKAASPRSA
jgi:hypothetical protein